MKRLRQSGQSMTEFLLVATAVVFALFYPFAGGESVASALLRAVLHCLRARSFVISIL